jgi:hypothetical protein
MMKPTYYYNVHIKLDVHTQGGTKLHQQLLRMLEGIR